MTELASVADSFFFLLRFVVHGCVVVSSKHVDTAGMCNSESSLRSTGSPSLNFTHSV